MFLLKTVPCLNDDFFDVSMFEPPQTPVDTSGFVDQQTFMEPNAVMDYTAPASDFFSTAGSKIGSTLVDVLDAYARKKAGLPATTVRNPNFLYNPDGTLMLDRNGAPVLRPKTGFGVASVPTWAWIAAGLGGLYLLTRRGR